MSQSANIVATASRGSDPQILASIEDVAPNLPAGLPKGLRNYWYPVLQSEELAAEKAIGFTALGEGLVAWRDRDGQPNVVHDRCPHRSIKLSVGRVFDGQLQCILHGLRFNGQGQCIMVPWEENDEHKAHWPAVTAYPARELGGSDRAFEQELQDQFPEGVVRGPVEVPGGQPGVGTAPDLREQVRFGIHGPDGPSQLPPEIAVSGVGHRVHAPTVHALRGPELRYP